MIDKIYSPFSSPDVIICKNFRGIAQEYEYTIRLCSTTSDEENSESKDQQKFFPIVGKCDIKKSKMSKHLESINLGELLIHQESNDISRVILAARTMFVEKVRTARINATHTKQTVTGAPLTNEELFEEYKKFKNLLLYTSRIVIMNKLAGKLGLAV